jgi:L-rhamnose mutarotase
MPREIHASVLRLRPEAEAEYRRIHADVWPSVLAQIARSHIRDYSIHLHDGLLFARFTYVGDDYAADLAAMAADPETQRWWEITNPMQEPLPTRAEGEWWAEMEPVFYFSGDAAG